MVARGTEGVAVAEWLAGTLLGDAALAAALGVTLANLPGRVWEGVAPDDTPAPFVVFSLSDPIDVGVVGGYRVMSRVEATVKVVGQGESYAPLVPVAARLDALLHARTNRPAGPVTGGLVLTTERLNGLQYPEQAGGVQYRHLGGLYQVHVQ